MDLLHVFPHLNAALNTVSCLMLLAGLYFIRSGERQKHRACMLTALAVSALFLVSYLAHHALRTYYFGLGPTRFTGEGIIRPIYFTILASHTVLAAAIGPFILLTLRRALRKEFDRHRRLARLVYPIWLFVSVSGVAVYLLLYQIYPGR